ncbi:hypothetical protein SLEP1_g32821 [Rubroshorea leprosula]|uniref:Glycoside hydrolase family 5 domain-containing protein n=1 Tax=Rubroshorea leprosula TaxID=152421 RepID=A0AAV5KEL8_9ROSI|nr:hypothetical protein SLEP1_g32821 [Rubroshorea leprosula]
MLLPLLLLLPLLTHHAKLVTGVSLSTNSRWIVDSQTGKRVKLACVNWIAHLEPVVAEGLNKQPVDVISKKIRSLGFNCIRFTWPVFLATDDSLASTTVRQSFQKLGLTDALSGIQAKNPSIIDLTLIKAFEAVVSNLRDNNLLVILDNHVSKPGWCCDKKDGNGFFGDQFFNPDLWIQGLSRMATMFKDFPNVIGMTLRNELRGRRENQNDWYNYMQKGAEAVHSANPNVLVILSGLNFDTDLGFLNNKPVSLSFTGKLVFEMHWYAFTNGGIWSRNNVNEACGRVLNLVMGSTGFLLQKGYPFFMSEFGVDMSGSNSNDNRYLNCLLGLAAELDLDWAIWTLVGNYYTRSEEGYGVLDANWSEPRNPGFLQKISSLQYVFQGPGEDEYPKQHKVIFHPATGLCVHRSQPLQLGPCSQALPCIAPNDKTLILRRHCLAVDDLGKIIKFGTIGGKECAKWDMISDSKMHLSAKLSNGTPVCLDVDSSTNRIVTNSCKCLGNDKNCDPSSQWFKIIDSTRTT